MATSLFDQEIQDVLQQARSLQTKTVIIDGRTVEIEKPFPSPADWRDQLIYMLLIDRFNNPDAPPKELVFDDEGNVRPVNLFQGGQIKGITAKLGYLQDLGVTALWLAPPLKNVQKVDGQANEGTYHGYGIQDFLTVDPRFGSDSDLQELVDQCHARGIYVILDVVINHSGDVFAYQGHGSVAPFQNTPYDTIFWRKADGQPNPNWRRAPDDLQGDPELTPDAGVVPRELLDNAFFRRQGHNLTGTVGDFFSLKELNTEVLRERMDDQGIGQGAFFHPVRDLMIEVHQYAIAKFDFDGFRIDTLKHVERAFARIFCNAVREFALSIGKKNFFIFGEVADDDKKIAEYTGRFASDPDSLIGADAALDFVLFNVLPGVIKGFNAPSQLANLFEDRKDLHRGLSEPHQVLISTHGEASRFFVTFLDNHDQKRRFRFSDPSDPNRFDFQVSMGIGCLLCLQGISVLYYGTEVGLHGFDPEDKDDKFVREALWGVPNGFDTNNPFYQSIQTIRSVQAQQPALRYGRQYFRQISGSGAEFGVSASAPGVLAFSRILNDTEVLVLANTFTRSSFTGFSVIDFAVNPHGTNLQLLYSNHGSSAASPGTVDTKAKGTVLIRGLRGIPLHITLGAS